MTRPELFRIGLVLVVFNLSDHEQHFAADKSSTASARSTVSAYHVVHGWPALPEGQVLGQVPGVTVDSHNHVFVFHRVDHYAGPNRVSKNDELIDVPTILCFE